MTRWKESATRRRLAPRSATAIRRLTRTHWSAIRKPKRRAEHPCGTDWVSLADQAAAKQKVLSAARRRSKAEARAPRKAHLRRLAAKGRCLHGSASLGRNQGRPRAAGRLS